MFEDYAIIPVDLPLPPVDPLELRGFVHSRCDRAYFQDNVPRFVVFSARKPVVDGQLLLHPADPRFALADGEFDWDPVFLRRFPEFAAWVGKFPFRRLQWVEVVTQTGDVPEHLDLSGGHTSVSAYESWRNLEPRFYRVVIRYSPGDDGADPGFYVSKEISGERRHLRLPPETRVFALGSSTCYHGADWRPRFSGAIVAVCGTLDEERHLELLRRSLERFGEHAVKLDPPGPVSGPGAATPYP